MLPKTIYFYWESASMSYLRYMTLYTFRAHNPDWKIVLIKRKHNKGGDNQDYSWAERQDFMLPPLKDYTSSLEELNITVEYLEDEYSEISKLDISEVHVSDILSWYILARKGGVVSDTDIIFTRKFPYEKYKDVVFGIVNFEKLPKPNYMPVSFMMSQPNVIHERIYQKSLINVNKDVYESAGTVCVEKSVGSFSDIGEYYSGDNYVKITRLPSKIVFPWAEDCEWGHYSSMAFNSNLYDKLSEDCIGVHWYAGAPGHQKINEAYSDGGYERFNNTISAAILAAKRVME